MYDDMFTHSFIKNTIYSLYFIIYIHLLFYYFLIIILYKLISIILFYFNLFLTKFSKDFFNIQRFLIIFFISHIL